MNNNKLRLKEKKDLMIKITRFLQKKLRFLIDVEGWTGKEIYDETGIPQNRISEILNFENYQRPINVRILSQAITGGIMTIDEIRKNVELNEKENDFLDELSIVEDKKMMAVYQRAKRAGLDPAEIIEKALNEKK